MARNYEDIYTHLSELDKYIHTHLKFISISISDIISFLFSSKASVYWLWHERHCGRHHTGVHLRKVLHDICRYTHEDSTPSGRLLTICTSSMWYDPYLLNSFSLSIFFLSLALCMYFTSSFFFFFFGWCSVTCFFLPLFSFAGRGVSTCDWWCLGERSGGSSTLCCLRCGKEAP